MTIFNLLLSLSPFLFLIYFIISMKKREGISYDIKKGYKCYSCKEDIESFDDRVQKLSNGQITSDEMTALEKLSLCKSCERDIKLNQLTSDGFIHNIKHKIDEYLLTEKSNKMPLIFILTFIPLITLDMFFLREYRLFFYIAHLFQITYWILFIRKHNLISIKKPNQ